jgi:hypothetical protein
MAEKDGNMTVDPLRLARFETWALSVIEKMSDTSLEKEYAYRALEERTGKRYPRVR